MSNKKTHYFIKKYSFSFSFVKNVNPVLSFGKYDIVSSVQVGCTSDSTQEFLNKAKTNSQKAKNQKTKCHPTI